MRRGTIGFAAKSYDPERERCRIRSSPPRFQFSLRWLLIAVTVVAVLLGLAVVSDRADDRWLVLLAVLLRGLFPTVAVVAAIYGRGESAGVCDWSRRQLALPHYWCGAIGPLACRRWLLRHRSRSLVAAWVSAEVSRWRPGAGWCGMAGTSLKSSVIAASLRLAQFNDHGADWKFPAEFLKIGPLSARPIGVESCFAAFDTVFRSRYILRFRRRGRLSGESAHRWLATLGHACRD